LHDRVLLLPGRACRELLADPIDPADKQQRNNRRHDEQARKLWGGPVGAIAILGEGRRRGQIFTVLAHVDRAHCTDLTAIARRTGCGMPAGAGLLIVKPRSVAATAASRSRSPLERNISVRCTVRDRSIQRSTTAR